MDSFLSPQRAHTRVSVASAKVIAWCCAGFMLHHTRMDTGCDDVMKVLLRLQGHVTKLLLRLQGHVTKLLLRLQGHVTKLLLRLQGHTEYDA